jgi:hypothetical protein
MRMRGAIVEILGRVERGVVVFEGEAALAEGTVVRVEPVEPETGLAALGRKLSEVSGSARGLPSDLAENHDHYLHGRPRR